MIEITDESIQLINEIGQFGGLYKLNFIDKLKYILILYLNLDITDKTKKLDLDLIRHLKTLDGNCLMSFKPEINKAFEVFKTILKGKELRIIKNLQDKYNEEYKTIISYYNELYDFLLKNRATLVDKLKKTIEIFNLTQCTRFDNLTNIFEGYEDFVFTKNDSDNDFLRNEKQYELEKTEQENMAIVFNHFMSKADYFYSKYSLYRTLKTFLESLKKMETEYAKEYFIKRCKYLDSSLFTESNLRKNKYKLLNNFAKTTYGCALNEKRIGLLFYLYNYYNEENKLISIDTERVRQAINDEAILGKPFDLNMAELITEDDIKLNEEINIALCWLREFTTDIDLNITCKKRRSVKSVKSIRSARSVLSARKTKSAKSIRTLNTK